MKYASRTLLLATAFVSVGTAAHAQNRAKDLASVVASERAFSRMSIDSTPQIAFNKYMAADAWLFRPRAIRALEFSRKNPLPPSLILTWAPEFADVSRAGDLAYTTGGWASGSRRVDAQEMFGQYLTIWKKQKDGRWLGAFNASLRTLAPEEAEPRLRSPALPSPYTKKASPAAEKSSMLAADNSFSNIARQRGYAEALRPIAHADIRTLRHTFHAIGVDSIVATHRGARVTMWMPVEAVVAASGDLGYTRGSYVISLPNNTNEPGDYVRIWRREANGTWRVVLDVLSPGR